MGTALLFAVALAARGPDLEPPAVAPLEWTACPFDTAGLPAARVRCGYVSVRENRDREGTKTIRLAFAVFKATTAASAKDAVLQLLGGPGIPALAGINLRLVAPGLSRDYDVVAFDQRGTGYSQPSMCASRAREDARIAARPLKGEVLRVAKKRADLACRDSLLKAGVDLQGYDSRASADDAEDLRRALAYERWILLGTSYGGALAQTVMSRHPASVRAAILVAPIRFDGAALIGVARANGTTLRKLKAICVADTACMRAFPDPEAEFYAVAERFVREPMPVKVDTADFGQATFVVDAADVVTVIDDMTSRDWELRFVPRLIRAFRDRDTAVISAAVSRAAGAGLPPGFSPGMQLVVNCHDFASPDVRRRRDSTVRAFPLEGELEFMLDTCDELPTGRASPREREPAGAGIPTLILSGRFDNRAPPEYSAGIMSIVRNSRQIVFTNASHALPGPTTWNCFQQIVLAFARNPSAFPDGSCATGPNTIRVSRELPDWAKD